MQGEMPLKTGPETLSNRMAAGTHQEIIFVTGKGGVGKSVAAAAIALKRARAGKKTLLAELGYQSFYKDYFGLPEVHYQPVPLDKNLDVALWSGPECLKEYALHLLKIESIYKLFFENPVTKALVNVAPALSELAILGKITSHPRKVGPPMHYDCLVVDAFATGHFLALLKAPKGMSEAIKFGPMGDQSRSIEKVLSDPAMSKYFVVSLPEEMPVIEGLELAEGIEQLVGIKPAHIYNRLVPVPADAGQVQELSPNLEKFQSYLKHVDQQQKELRQKFGSQKVFDFPMVYSADAREIVSQLSEVAP